MPMMERREDNRPWRLIVVLVICAAAGIISVPLQVAILRQSQAASAADVRRAQELTVQLAEQQERQAAEAKQFREDSRRLTLAICDQIEAVAEQVGLDVPPCPRVMTNPAPMPTPSG